MSSTILVTVTLRGPIPIVLALWAHDLGHLDLHQLMHDGRDDLGAGYLLHGGPPVLTDLVWRPRTLPTGADEAGRTASNFYELPDNLETATSRTRCLTVCLSPPELTTPTLFAIGCF